MDRGLPWMVVERAYMAPFLSRTLEFPGGGAPAASPPAQRPRARAGRQRPGAPHRGAVATPYLDELVRRLRLVHPGRRGRGRGEGATIGWRDDRLGHPLLLFVGERDLAAAGTSLGEDCRDLLWPDGTIEEAGVSCCSSTWERSSRPGTRPRRWASHLRDRSGPRTADHHWTCAPRGAVPGSARAVASTPVRAEVPHGRRLTAPPVSARRLLDTCTCRRVGSSTPRGSGGGRRPPGTGNMPG